MSRDLHAYSRKTRAGLVGGFFALVFVVGGGLIYLLYGQGAALFGWFCLGLAALPVILVAGVLVLLDRVAEHAGRK